MPSYVAFLRAINLGATRKFPKAELVAATEAAGATDVRTYINTGNVRVTMPVRSAAKVEAALEKAYLAQTGFEVPTIAFTVAEMVSIADRAEELATANPGSERRMVFLLKETPDPDKVAALEARSGDSGVVVVQGRAVHLVLKVLEPGNPDPFRIEKALGVAATGRTAKVIATVAETWCR